MTTELQKSPQVDLKGYLLRYETFKGRSGWKKRWAVLCDYCLYLYKDQNSKECFFALLLPSSAVSQSHDSSGQYRSSIKIEEQNQQPVYLSTETPLDFEMWFEALSGAAQMRRAPTQQQQQQQYSQSQTIVTTTTTQQQQQQQQRDLGYSVGFDSSLSQQQQQHRQKFDYPDNVAGHAGDSSMSLRVSQPTLATADGQYSVRQMRPVGVGQSDVIVYDASVGGLAGVRGGNVGIGGSASAAANGSVTETRVERTVVERVNQQQDTQGSSSSSGHLVRAEPVRASSSAGMTGRYEVRAEVTSQQQQRPTQTGRDGRLGGSMSLGASNFSLNQQRHAIETVREDPHMDESEIIATAPLDEIKRKYPVSGLAKRMSIAASDLLGKSHDELLLLLIQLNREKASLERRRDYYQALLRRQPDMRGADRMQGELREIDNQIELHDPLITFIGNIISMGALYNGDDVMFASEYRQHLLQPGELKPVKANVGFIRRQQEREVARQFSEQAGLGVDTVDATASGVESQEFRVTRQQLEAELHELESVYADHRRRKSNLAAFMSDLGRRSALGRPGLTGGGGGSGHQTTSGSYLETDLDTGASVDLAAKFPHRRTAVGPRQLATSAAVAAANGGASGVTLRQVVAGTSLDRRVVNSASDEVFQYQQQKQHRSLPASAYEVKSTATTTVTTFGGAAAPAGTTVEQLQTRQQKPYGVTVDVSTSGQQSSSQRIPDPDDFLQQRRSTLQFSSGAGVSGVGVGAGVGLPPGQPPPEMYVSQPQLYRAPSGGGGGGGVSISVQDRLNLALGYDLTDSGAPLPAVVQTTSRKSTSTAGGYELTPGVKKPLIQLDTNRYKRNANNYALEATARGDHRTEALDNLGQFVEDMKGLDRGTYFRVEQ